MIKLNTMQKKLSLLLCSFALIAACYAQKHTDSTKLKASKQEIYTTYQIESEFSEGGNEGWIRYITQNLNGDIPTQNKAPKGKYVVVLSYKIDKDGGIGAVTVEKDPGYGAAEEATRVIKGSPKWIPANQNGRNVASIKKQTITFIVG